ncbi:murein L,D-transpeptidase [Myxococcota bacterium]|nr:murein L,D-transpeptidase [Myxococcota bacterium]
MKTFQFLALMGALIVGGTGCHGAKGAGGEARPVLPQPRPAPTAEGDAGAPPPIEAPAKVTTVPESARSQAAAAAVAPKLAPRLAAKGLRMGAPAFVRIFKQEHELEVWLEKDGAFVLLDTWKIAFYSGDLGPKLAEGDRQAPEGFYFVPPGMLNPNSSYHLAFNVGYPNAFDRDNGRTGSYILVHGSNVSIGCFAMTDPGIEEIYTLVSAALQAGQPFFRVHIFPFRMTDVNLAAHRLSPHLAFWRNLKEGHDRFEKDRVPPEVTVRDRKYVFR